MHTSNYSWTISTTTLNSFYSFSGQFFTSSNRFCKSGIDLVLAAVLPGVNDVAEGVDVDAEELGCCCFDFFDASFSFCSSNITCLKYSMGGT